MVDGRKTRTLNTNLIDDLASCGVAKFAANFGEAAGLLTRIGALCCAASATSCADDACAIFVHRTAPIQWTAAVVVENWARQQPGATAVSRRAQARSWRRKRRPALGAGGGLTFRHGLVVEHFRTPLVHSFGRRVHLGEVAERLVEGLLPAHSNSAIGL